MIPEAGPWQNQWEFDYIMVTTPNRRKAANASNNVFNISEYNIQYISTTSTKLVAVSLAY